MNLYACQSPHLTLTNIEIWRAALKPAQFVHNFVSQHWNLHNFMSQRWNLHNLCTFSCRNIEICTILCRNIKNCTIHAQFCVVATLRGSTLNDSLALANTECQLCLKCTKIQKCNFQVWKALKISFLQIWQLQKKLPSFVLLQNLN